MDLIATLYKFYYGKYFRIFLAVVVFIVGFVIINIINNNQYYDELLQLRKVELKRITTIAYNTIKPTLMQFRLGKINKSDALQKVTGTVRNMTFSDNINMNYVFMSGYDGKMLVQPYEPDSEGLNLLDLQDIYGKYIIKELIKAAKSKAGSDFVEYYYYPPLGNEEKLKISYVKGIPELEAYIGVGMYVHDLDAIYKSGRLYVFLLDFIVVGISAVIIFLFTLPYLKSYSIFATAFDAIQKNPSLRPIIQGVKRNPKSALDKLVHSFDKMLNTTFQRQEELQHTQKMLLDEIEEKISTQKALAKTMAILKEELAQSPAGIVITDSKTMTASMISKSAVDILGINLSHLPQLTLAGEKYLPFKFYDIDGNRVYFRDLSLYASTTSGLKTQNRELQVIRKDGEKKWILTSTSPIFDENKTLIAGIAVFLDISERKSYQFKIEKLNKELENRVMERTSQLEDAMNELKISREQILEETQKLYEVNNKLISSQNQLREVNASKDRFFNIIAHDIKSPLAGFQSMLEVMALNYEKLTVEENKKFINMLQNTSKQLFDLLENLLNWARSQTGALEFEPSITDLSNILISITKLYANILDNKNIKLEIELKEVNVFADIFMLNTIMRNLISNAIKFSNENSKITITTDKSGDYIRIKVADSGVGIKEEDKLKLFRIDVNHTTIGTKKESGTGLGLILCKEFAERHGGKIEVESKLGKGSTFTILLPNIPK